MSEENQEQTISTTAPEQSQEDAPVQEQPQEDVPAEPSEEDSSSDGGAQE